MRPELLFAALFFGAVGIGYFIYGKKQQRFVALISGITLCVVPYFIHGIIPLVLVGLVFTVLPFVIRS